MSQPVILLVLLAVSAGTPARVLADSWLFMSLKDERRIVTYERDPVDGKVVPVTSTDCPGEPGPLSASPDGRLLFASIRSTGHLASYRVDSATGKLKPLSVVNAGEDPAFHTTDRTGRFLLTAYYHAAKVTVHAIEPDGRIRDEPLQSVPTDEKAHAVAFDPSGRFVFVPHTGPDAIYQFRFDTTNSRSGPLQPNTPPILRTPAGDAPRHMVFHPSRPFAWTDNEAGDSVTSFRLDTRTGTLTPIQTVSTLPGDFAEPDKNACAALQISPNGRFLYAANRGHESVACFVINEKTGRVTSLGQTKTGRTPRSISVDPQGRFLYAAGQNDNTLWTYRIQADGRLKHESTQRTGTRPWWIMTLTQSKGER